MARIAEDTWRALEQPLGLITPPRRTRSCSPIRRSSSTATRRPSRTTRRVCTRWRRRAPVSTSMTGCGSLFTHEFTHIVHLDRSEGWARVARNIFGRTPYAFPNLFLPLWQVEGLATYEESAITGEGRLHAGDFRAIVGEAAQPGTSRAARSGQRRPDRLAGRPGHLCLRPRLPSIPRRPVRRRVAGERSPRRPRGRVPYLAAPAFKQVYQRVARRLVARLRSQPGGERATLSEPDPVDHAADAPGFLDQRAALRSLRRAQAVRPTSSTPPSTPTAFPRSTASAAGGGEPRRLTTRYLGSTTAIAPRSRSTSTSSSCGETSASTAISTSSRAPTAASVS